jgi:hypothetical protein
VNEGILDRGLIRGNEDRERKDCRVAESGEGLEVAEEEKESSGGAKEGRMEAGATA